MFTKQILDSVVLLQQTMRGQKAAEVIVCECDFCEWDPPNGIIQILPSRTSFSTEI